VAKAQDSNQRDDDRCCTTSSIADKDHCTVYTANGRRFGVPLAYLGTVVFSELLRTMSEEEFGFTGDGGRITLPCDAAVVEYVMCGSTGYARYAPAYLQF